MSHWEYKVLSGGKMGLGSMAMLEQFLNELGQQQWEVVSWQTDPETPLKFHGLAKRPILRDLSPQEMPAAMDKDAIAAAKEEEERERQAWIETLAREREFYARAIEEEGAPASDSDDEDEERDLVGDLFETIRPLMKRNKRGPGASGSVVYLAKKLDQSEDDLIGALAEAGLELDDDESDSEPHEHGSEVFWLNSNSRGEVWINSMPKSRYKPAKKEGAGDNDKKPETKQTAERPSAPKEPPPPPGPLPEGAGLLEKLKPLMRRNRGGRGLSGSLPFLSRALRHSEADLAAALATLGLVVPEDPKVEPAPVEIEGGEYWMNRNEKGQVWINAREAGAEKEGAPVATEAPSEAAVETPAAAPELLSAANALALSHPHLAKVGRSTTVSAAASDVAAALGVSQASLVDALVGAGLQVPVEASDKPVTVDSDGNQFWFSRGDDEALFVNAKPVRKSRGRKRG